MLPCKMARGVWYLVYLKCRSRCATQGWAAHKTIFGRPAQATGTVLSAPPPLAVNCLLFLRFTCWRALTTWPATTICGGPIFGTLGAVCAWLVSRKTSNACRKGPNPWSRVLVPRGGNVALPKGVPSDFSCALVYRIQGCGSGSVCRKQNRTTRLGRGNWPISFARLQPLLSTGPTDVGLAISTNFLTMIAMTAAGCAPRKRAFCVMCIATLFGEVHARDAITTRETGTAQCGFRNQAAVERHETMFGEKCDDAIVDPYNARNLAGGSIRFRACCGGMGADPSR